MAKLPAKIAPKNKKPSTMRRTRQKTMNSSFTGSSGALGTGDRGARQVTQFDDGNPYNSTDYVYRWRQYVRLYQTSWEARKIVRIVPEDALRKQWIAEDIPEEMAKKIQTRLDELKFTNILSRSLMLERLLGGCLTFLGLEAEEDDPEKPYDVSSGEKLQFINAIPVSRISQVDWETRPLSKHYMRPNRFSINGEVVHVSRCLLWDGEPLLDPQDFFLQTFRGNLAGFGPSKLAPIWDDIVKAVGTRQAAYQLIQVNNSIIAAVEGLTDLAGTTPGKLALDKVKSVANQLSVYRAAVIDGDKIKINQHSASFGSVPELIMTFIQILSAASDIPATRFLGQAPGGLNATGDSDLENYYNMIDSYQRQRVEPAVRKIYDVLGYEMFPKMWGKAREKLTFKFPPLWNLNELEEAQTNAQNIANVMLLHEQNLVNDQKAIEEINAKGALSVTLDSTDMGLLDDFGTDLDLDDDLDRRRAETQTREMNFPTVPIRKRRESPQPIPDTSKAGGVRYPQKSKAYNMLDLDQLPEPTAAQVASGNYKKHHIKLRGLPISIENVKGSTRSGFDAGGQAWSVEMPAHYGYVKRTEGEDGDELDVYIGDNEESNIVYVVKQLDADSKEFDEFKCILGTSSKAEAEELYLSGFSDGRGKDRLGFIVSMSMDDFKEWIAEGMLSFA